MTEQQTITIQQAIDLAVQFHQAGNLLKAESIYQQILQASPKNPIALNLLGVIANQFGKNDVSIDLITKALVNKPDYAEAHSNLGLALQNLGRLDEAVASYNKAIAINTDYADAHNNLGNALNDQGKFNEALFSNNKAIAINPNHPEGHYNLGNALKGLGRLDEAVVSYNKALVINPNYAEAHSNLGNALKDLENLEEAISSYNKALVINPNYAEAHSNLGVTQAAIGKLDEAVISYNKALAINPNYSEANNNLGNALQALGKLDEAVASYRKAIAIEPSFTEAYSNLGITLNELGKLDDAVASHKKALAIKPDHFDSNFNMGAAYMDLQKYDTAIAYYFASDPNFLNPIVSATILECYFHQNDMAGYHQHLQLIRQSKAYNFRAGAASAFVAQQVCESNTYEFCKDPVDLVTTYNVFQSEGENVVENEALIQTLEHDIHSDNWNEQLSPGHISSGYKSIGNLLGDGSERTLALNALLRRFIDRYFKKHCSKKSLFIDNWPTNYDLDGWYIRLESGGEISAHVHTAWVSGVLYIRLPKKSTNGEGNIEFSLRGYDLPIIKDNYPRRIIETAPGVLVLFPSSLPHRVIPFKSEDERICIAFDMKPR